jgi:hypothetical protein
MAVGLPLKTTYVNGDVFSASDINDTNGTINTTAAPFAAGKNAIINGNFSVNQRNFTSTTTPTTFGHDRWRLRSAGGTATYSTQAFTAGTAPVAGYEGTNFARLVTSGQSGTNDYASIEQPIEDVRTFAGQTVTVSFWAKASTGTPNIGLSLQQYFGVAGSASIYTSPAIKTITSSWVRYSFNVAVPSVAGKTITTSTNLSLWLETSVGTSISAAGFAAVGIQNVTIDIWGVQVEAGSTATGFQTATGTIQGELAACQRYYWRFSSDGKAYASLNTAGYFSSTTQFLGRHQFPVIMRTNPTVIDAANLSIQDTSGTLYAVSAAAIDTNTNTTSGTSITYTVSGATSARFGSILVNNNTGAYIGLGAEL